MNRGFIGYVILIVVALALAKYFFDWSIFDALNTEQGKETVEYVKNILNIIWGWVQKIITFLKSLYGKVS